MGQFVVIKGISHAKKRLDSLEIHRRMGATHCLPVAHLDAGSLTRIDDSNRRETDESADPVRQLGRFRATQDALLRLATNPQDACALVAVHDMSGKHLRASAVRWFGRDPELRSRAVLSILVAIGRQAGSYDPHSMDAAQWVSRVADAEAKRLREALDKAVGKSPWTRRAM
jgi:hypothetical protein